MFERLSNKNYASWSFKMKMFLDKEGCWEPVSSEKPTSVKEDDWKKIDKKALFYIAMYVESNQLIHIKKAANSREAWDSLKKIHQKSTLGSKIRLKKKLYKAQLMNDGNMEDHLHQMVSWFDELEEMGDNITEDNRVSIILSSLNDEYEALVTGLEIREEDLTMDFVKGKLLEEWEKRNGKSEESERALKVSRKGKSSKVTCYFCKKEGHYKNDCKKYKKWLAENSNSSDEEAESANTVTQRKTVAFSASKLLANGWIVDSGASCHMCNDIELFTDINTKHREKIYTADGKSMMAKGKGTATICVQKGGKAEVLSVREALYVPQLEGNLLSVQKLSEKGFDVVFKKNQSCQIFYEGEIVTEADLKYGLYKVREGKRNSQLIRQSKERRRSKKLSEPVKDEAVKMVETTDRPKAHSTVLFAAHVQKDSQQLDDKAKKDSNENDWIVVSNKKKSVKFANNQKSKITSMKTDVEYSKPASRKIIW